MAELLLNLHNNITFEPDDVLAASNWRCIRHEHASRICDRYAPAVRNGDGLIAINSLAEKWYRHTCQYRFERVSRNEIRRVNQWTGTDIVYGSTPVEDPDRPGHMIHCNVNEFFARRLKHAKHVVCGTPGSEVYYEGDGRKDFSHAKLDLVWNEITTSTGMRDVDFPTVPLSTVQLRRFLAVPTEDFSDEKRVELESKEEYVDDVLIQAITPVAEGVYDVQFVGNLPTGGESREFVDADGESFSVESVRGAKTVRVSGRKPPQNVGLQLPTMRTEGRNRLHKVDWRSILPRGVTETDVMDTRKRIDIRQPKNAVPVTVATVKSRRM